MVDICRSSFLRVECVSSSLLHAKPFWLETWTFRFCFLWDPGSLGKCFWLLSFGLLVLLGFASQSALCYMQWPVDPASPLLSKPLCHMCALFKDWSFTPAEVCNSSVLKDLRFVPPTRTTQGWVGVFPSARYSLWFSPILSRSSVRNIGFLLEILALHPAAV